MDWTWDKRKNEQNVRSHGISFETAIHVFDDPYAVTKEDPYRFEQRWRTMGMIDAVLVVVVHTWLDCDEALGSEFGRIISARKATKKERRAYEEEKY